MATIVARSIGNHPGYSTGYKASSDATGLIITLTTGVFDGVVSEGDVMVFTASGAFSSAFSMGFNTSTMTSYVSVKNSNTQITLQTPIIPNLTNMSWTIARAFSNLPAWEAARPINLVTSDIVWKGIMNNDTIFAAGLTIPSSIVNDSTHYIWLTANNTYYSTHDGKSYNLFNGVRLEISTGQAISCAYGGPYNIFEKIQIKCTNAGTLGISDRGIIRNMIVYSTGGATAGIDVYQSSGQGSIAYNNLIYGGGSLSVRNTAAAYNNTIHGSASYGVSNSSTTPNIYNTISMSSVIADYASGFGGSNNMSSDSTAPGTSSLINKITYNQFQNITAGSENYTLKQIGDKVISSIMSDAIGAGINESSIFTTDARGATRPASWDIGSIQHSTIITKTIGSVGRDYTTIAAWIAACPSNLLTTCQIWKGVCYKDSVFNERVNMYGAFTGYDSYYYLTVAPDNRHTGKAGTGVIIECSNRTVGIQCGYYATPINNGFHVVEYFEVRNCSGYGDQLGSLYAGSPYCIFRNNLIYNTLGTINFNTDFITGNIINASVNGVSISPITYTTSHSNTATLLLAALNALPGVTSTKDTYGHIYYINNFKLSASVTGGASQPIINILQGCGLYFAGGNGATLGIWCNNIVYNMYVGMYGGSIGTTPNKHINNTITACTYGLVNYTNGSDTFINNIIIGNGLNYSALGSFASFYNNIKEVSDTITGYIISGNINDTSTNCFANPTIYDYRLKASSLAKNAGLNQSTIFTNDVISSLRTLPWDIGAFMYYSLIKCKPPAVLFMGRGIFDN